MYKKMKIVLCVILAAAAVAGVSAAAVTSYGSQEDPLITKSYLDETLTPQLVAQFESMLGTAGTTENGSFAVLTLTNGQTVICQTGGELLLRGGSATVVADDTPGLVDTTDGTVLENGFAITQNHLYLASVGGHGIRAASAAVTVLVSGSYTVS